MAVEDPWGGGRSSSWNYGYWNSGEPYDWGQAGRGESPYDNQDFHVDLGCGRLKKARIGIDRFEDPGVDIVMNLDTMEAPMVMGRGALPSDVAGRWYSVPGLPFDDGQIESIISHHFMEHVGGGFIRLMEECWRVLKPGGLLRIIVPLFPSHSAISDPDHKRYFGEDTFLTFTGKPGETHWMESFSTPYHGARFTLLDQDMTPPPEDPKQIGLKTDARELRVALEANK